MSRPRKAAAGNLPYPKLPDSAHKGFWLAVYLQQQAELDQLQRFSQTKECKKKNLAFTSAIYLAIHHYGEEIKLSLGYAKKDGLLPFAHASTTYFAEVNA